MLNLRALAEADLSTTLCGEFKIPVQMIDPEGNRYDTGLDGKAIGGMVHWSRTSVNPENGLEVVMDEPIVYLRRSVLPRIPVSGEKWMVKIPVDPTEYAEWEWYALDDQAATREGQSLGLIKLPLVKAKQPMVVA
ncbi:hypothetical protein FACS189479_04450 [Spirochaetia bacterium]|nr:hypothetical protein FACS189479_04450 [Spirochaetia bacterium]